MSYQVIARKYRPQTFADLTGQEHIVRTLSQALESKRLHHAYLFSGVRGTGKTTSARILAKGLNCHRGLTSQPCLQCASCLEIAAGNSLDVLEIDAASNTGVDNVRDVIINNIALAPARDRYKIFVIDEVHMLSTSAFNALLKTLEEPPSHVVFIMATTELHKVPDTILSRCQQFEFRQIPAEKIFLRLREIANNESIKIDDPALRLIARAGAGSLRDSQSAFDQVIAFSGAEITEEDVTTALGLVGAAILGRFATAIAKQATSDMLNLVEEIASRGIDLRNFTRELMAYLRHLLIVKSGIVNGEILGVANVEIERLKELALDFSEEDLVRFFHLLAETEKEIKDSPHPRFQLEIGLVKLTHAARLRTLDELIKRLEALESKMAGGGATSGRRGSEFSGASGGTPQATIINKEGGKDLGRKDGEEEALTSPDFPDFDQTEPIDLLADSLPPSKPSPQSSSIKAQPEAARSTITPGREVEAIRGELQRLNRMLLLTALEEARQIQYRDDTIRITFEAETVLSRRFRDEKTLREMKEIGEKLFGQPLKVEVVISGQTEVRVDEAVLQRQERHERVAKNPVVQSIIEKTRGEIVWVKEQT